MAGSPRFGDSGKKRLDAGFAGKTGHFRSRTRLLEMRTEPPGGPEAATVRRLPGRLFAFATLFCNRTPGIGHGRPFRQRQPPDPNTAPRMDEVVFGERRLARHHGKMPRQARVERPWTPRCKLGGRPGGDKGRARLVATLGAIRPAWVVPSVGAGSHRGPKAKGRLACARRRTCRTWRILSGG